MRASADQRDLPQPGPLLSHREPVRDFAEDERAEHAELLGRLDEPNDPHHGVEQARIEPVHGHGSRTARAPPHEGPARKEPNSG